MTSAYNNSKAAARRASNPSPTPLANGLALFGFELLVGDGDAVCDDWTGAFPLGVMTLSRTWIRPLFVKTLGLMSLASLK